MEASISAHGTGSSTHLSALVTASAPREQHHSYPGHLYHPAAALNFSIPAHHTLYQQSSNGSPRTIASPTRTALIETSANTNQPPPSSHTDEDGYFYGKDAVLKAKLAERRQHRAERAIERQISGHHQDKYSTRSPAALEGSKDRENLGSKMPAPYSEYRGRVRDKNQGVWDEEMEGAFMEGELFHPAASDDKLIVDVSYPKDPIAWETQASN